MARKNDFKAWIFIGRQGLKMPNKDVEFSLALTARSIECPQFLVVQLKSLVLCWESRGHPGLILNSYWSRQVSW